jgi:hypothetical protein
LFAKPAIHKSLKDKFYDYRKSLKTSDREKAKEKFTSKKLKEIRQQSQQPEHSFS